MGEIVREVKTSSMQSRLIRYGPGEWSYGAVFLGWKKEMNYIMFEVPINPSIPYEITIKSLIDKLNGLRNKATLEKINIAAYNITIHRNKAKITIYSDKPITRKYAGFFFDIGKIISGIGEGLNKILGGISRGVHNFFTPDIVLGNPNAGPGLGEIVLAGMVIFGGFLIVDTIMRKEAAVAAKVPIKPYYAPAVEAPVEYAKVFAPVTAKAIEYPTEMVKTAGKLAVLAAPVP